jgi:DNA-binding NtrC family response regulator
VVERAALGSTSTTITRADLPRAILEPEASGIPSVERSRLEEEAMEGGLDERLRGYEAELLSATLRRTGGNRTAAAALLKVPLRTLYRRIKELGLKDT